MNIWSIIFVVINVIAMIPIVMSALVTERKRLLALQLIGNFILLWTYVPEQAWSGVIVSILYCSYLAVRLVSELSPKLLQWRTAIIIPIIWVCLYVAAYAICIQVIPNFVSHWYDWIPLYGHFMAITGLFIRDVFFTPNSLLLLAA